MRVSRHRMNKMTDLADKVLRSQRKICRDKGNFIAIKEIVEEMKVCHDIMLLAATENCNRELKLCRETLLGRDQECNLGQNF